MTALQVILTLIVAVQALTALILVDLNNRNKRLIAIMELARKQVVELRALVQ